MKSLLLCFLVGLAVASNVVKDNAFLPGHEYLYHYDTQLLTGLPHTSTLYAGFRLQCHARVQFITYSKVRVQLEDITLYRINDPIQQDHPQQRLLPVEYLKELIGEESTIMQRFLHIPFAFTYSDGIVASIALSDTETEWSANAKRGFVALFQMNLKKRMILQDSVQTMDQTEHKRVDIYDVMEESTLGSCATLYTVAESDLAGSMYVTKTRDFKRCVAHPVYFKSIFENQHKSKHLRDEPLLQEANAKYSVRGTTDRFIILSAVTEGRVLFSPYKNQGEILSSMNQTMYLRNSKSIEDSKVIPPVTPGDNKRTNLRMTLPSESVDPQDPFNLKELEPKQVQNPADVYTAEKILLHLNLAAEDTIRLTSQQSLTHLRVVIDMMKTSPKQVLEKLWTILSNKDAVDEISKLSSELMWKVLPHVATDAAADLILDICNTEFRMTKNCTMAINNLALRATPTSSLIAKLIVLTDDRLKHVEPSVKQAGYLALGSLGYKLVMEKRRIMDEIERSEKLLLSVSRDTMKNIGHIVHDLKQNLKGKRTAISNYVSSSEEQIMEAIDRLLASPSFDDKVLALKTIGNSGMQEGFTRLEKFLSNPAEPQILRVLATIGFRRMWYPETARRLAIHVLRQKVLDTRESSEIRNMAFEIMSGLEPDLTIYEAIADSLRTEKDKHVSSYIMSFFMTYANSTFPPEQDLRQNCTAALLLAPRERLPDFSSFIKQKTMFNEDYKMGSSWRFATLGDRNGYKGAALDFDTYIMGYVSNLFEVGVNTQGLSSVIDKLFGPKGLLSHKKSLFDLLKRMPRDLNPQQKIDEIFKLLQIKPRVASVPYGHLYVKLMGHEVRYWDFTSILRKLLNEDAVPLMFDEGSWSVGMPVDINTMYHNLETQLTLATETGIPLSLKLQSLAAVDIKGNVQFKVGPELLQSEREGKPPVSVFAAVDLKPKVVVGTRCQIVIDMFYYKPAVGFNALMESDFPINMDLHIDTVYNKLKINNYLAHSKEGPYVQVLIEPFSDFQKVSQDDLNPVLLQAPNNIFAPYGSRIKPISKEYSLDYIGYKMAVTGQAPEYLSLFNAFRQMNGRTLYNVFFKPTQTAARLVTLNAQLVYPEDESVVSPLYAQTYQETQTQMPGEEEEEEEDAMDNTEEPQYNKYGKPLEKTLKNILPYSDPVNLDVKTVTLQQLANKLQNITGKPVPLYNLDDAYGLVMTLDASYETFQRELQLETIFARLLDGQYNVWMTRLWRSAIPNVDPHTAQAIIEKVLTYPMEVFEPKDIFDPRKQAQIMSELQYLISLDAHKVINQILNLTTLTVNEQLDYPSRVHALDRKIVDSLVTEQLYNLMNMTGSPIYSRKWELYWEDLLPLFDEIQEQRRLIVERYYEEQEVSILEQLEKLERIQSRFMDDLDNIISEGFLEQGEKPVMQSINEYQMKSAYLMAFIVEKAAVKALIPSYDLIRERLGRVLKNVDDITKKVAAIWESVTTMTHDVSKDEQPTILFKPVIQKRPQVPINDYEMQESSQTTLADLIESLYYLSHTQMKVIKELESAVYNEADFKHEIIQYLIQATSKNITLFDEIFAAEQTDDKIVRESMLLITVQNDMAALLFEEWVHLMDDLRRPTEGMKRIQYKWVSTALLAMKEQSEYLAQRSSILFCYRMASVAILPYLSVEEVPIYRKIGQLMSEMVPQVRAFELSMAFNTTAMRDPESIAEAYTSAISDTDQLITEAFTIVTDIKALSFTPKIYLVSELMSTITYIKRQVEFTRTSLLSLQDSQRLVYIAKLNEQSTRVQSLLSSMAVIFKEYTEFNEETQNEFKNTVPRIPINMRILDLQDIRIRQKMLYDEIKNYIRSQDVSNSVLSEVLNVAIDRIEVLQEDLKQVHPEVLVALDESKQYHRDSMSAIYTEVITHQSALYDLVRRGVISNRDRVSRASQLLDRISSLELNLSEMRNEKDKKISDIKAQDKAENVIKSRFEMDQDMDSIEGYKYDNDQDYVGQKMSKNVKKPITSKVGISHGIEAFLNVTWGRGDILDKSFHAELIGSRTVEQMMYIVKQMDAVLRSSHIARAIDNRLSGETWKNDAVLQQLNSYNHLHLVAHYDKTTLPRWVLNYATYLQEYMKVMYWEEYSRQGPMSFVPEGEFHVMWDISDINRQSDLYLLTNTETDRFMGMQQKEIFKRVPKYQPYKVSKPKYYARKCILNKDKLFTMDKVSYVLAPQVDKCKAVLAMDCSMDKSFAMTIVKSNSSYEGYNLLILAGDKEIELIPGDLSTAVKVNGRHLLLKENMPVVYRKTVQYGTSREIMVIRRTGLKVEVGLPLTGIYVSMQGDYIEVEVSMVYHKKMCGLCSNYDGQLSWEYQGPRQEVYTTASPFAYSYILREGECPINARPLKEPRRPKGSDGRIDEEDDDESEDTQEQPKKACEPVQMISIRRLRKSKQRKQLICVGEEPVTKCPKPCQTKKTQKRRVTYRCVEKDDQQLLEIIEAKKMGILNLDTDLTKLEAVKKTLKPRVRHAVECGSDDDDDSDESIFE